MKTDFNKLNTTGARSSAEVAKFTAAQHLAVETSCAFPDYLNWQRTVAANEADPTATPPDAPNLLWDLRGYRSAHAYLSFTAGTAPTAVLELWGYDKEANAYFLIAASAATAGAVEIRFDEQIRNRTVFVRITTITGAPTDVTLHFCPE